MTSAKTITLIFFLLLGATVTGQLPTCSEPEVGTKIDPNLKEITWTLDGKEEKALIWIPPHVTSFYEIMAPALEPVVPKHNGLAAKFINMSNKPVRLYWEPHAGGKASLMSHVAAFSPTGTASFPGHRFFLTPDEDPENVLIRFIIGNYPNNIYTYDPYLVEGDTKSTLAKVKSELSNEELVQYMAWRKTLAFNEVYKQHTGRSYLAKYLRHPAIHYIWPADYFSQTHWVTSKETHFLSMPPSELLGKIDYVGNSRILNEDDPRHLSTYRAPGIAKFTLRVLSCQPRVFEIPNFLSDVEVAHILSIAGGEDLKQSSTGSSGPGERAVEGSSKRTRTSLNSWVERERSPIFDAIYRRSADLLRIDEALLRHRGDGEYAELKTNKTLAESLQLVHYDPKQEYTAHHDFGYAKMDTEFQSARFATLLFYLNDEGLVGGETGFPRYLNAESFTELKVTPKKGKAVLFYSQLPDGNFDDLSQHAAKPVRVGEKWLINLWVWDPKYPS